ncbi:unnamed protein product [Thelazia callipaeda]|uniref:Zinc transporter 2 n=1 Tax=Thelazia callipaeda TaxID=103827 RepID=A0A0N5CMD2_THECL|nr:unnamed protein product [Thelazia callipaeda]
MRVVSPDFEQNIESNNDDIPLYYCDKNDKLKNDNRRALRSLSIASVVTTIFIVIEFLGGYFANSLAVMTDAGHMVSDLLSFFVSIAAIKLAEKEPTKRLPFGYYRAEVLGALVSILMIWTLTAVLVYSAIERTIQQDFKVDAVVMLYTALISVLFNLVMGVILHLGKMPHSHFGASDNHRHEKTTTCTENGTDKVCQEGINNAKCGHDCNQNIIKVPDAPKNNPDQLMSVSNINLRAAFIHVLGDFIQSIGVLAAAVVIKLTDYHLADPICTFLFSILVMLTTFPVVRDSVLVLMESSPRNINLNQLHNDLRLIKGVREVHSLRVWSLTPDKTALCVHLETEKDCDTMVIIHEANEKLRISYRINFITIQVRVATHL